GGVRAGRPHVRHRRLGQAHPGLRHAAAGCAAGRGAGAGRPGGAPRASRLPGVLGRRPAARQRRRRRDENRRRRGQGLGRGERARFVGHTGAVTGLFVATRAEGQPLTSAGTDRAVRTWPSARTTVLGTRFAGHESWVTSLALTPDGKKLVSGSWDGTVRVWDVQTGKEPTVLESHESKIYAVAVSRDGKRAASAGGNGEVFVWDLESNAQVARLEGHDEESEVNGIAFTPGGKRVVTAASDGDIKVWDAETGKELSKIKGPREGILAFALSPDGKRAVASGAPGHACIVYDL